MDLVVATCRQFCGLGRSGRPGRGRLVGSLARLRLGRADVRGQAKLLADTNSIATLQSVQRDQFTHANVMPARDRRQRVAAADGVFGVSRLPRMSMFLGHSCDAGVKRLRQTRPGHLDIEAFRDVFRSAPDRRAQVLLVAMVVGAVMFM